MRQVAKPEPKAYPSRRASAALPSHGAGRPASFSLASVVAGQTVVASNLLNWKRLQQAVDDYGPQAMFTTDEVFVIEQDTKLELIRKTLGWAKVRVIDGPFAGRTGFVIPETV